MTPMHEASRSKRTEAMQALLRSGANTVVANKDGDTPLHLAVRSADAVRVLLLAGASVEARNHEGACALLSACVHGDVEVLKLLLQAGQGANVNTANGKGMTPVHVAAHYGHEESLRLLVEEHGADVHAKRAGNGHCTLHTAAAAGNAGCVQALLDAGADANETDSAGQSPLHLAAKKQHAEVVRVLLRHGAALDEPDNSGSTPADMIMQRKGAFDSDIMEAVVTALRGRRGTPRHRRGGAAGSPTASGAIELDPLRKDIDAVAICVPVGAEAYVASGLVILDGLLSFADFISDIIVSIQFFYGADIWWGILSTFILVISWSSTMTTVVLSNSAVYTRAEQALRLALASTGLFPLGLSLGLKVVGKSEFVFFEQLRMLEVFVESIPELLLQMYVLVITVSRAGGSTATVSSAQVASLTLSLLSVANAVFDSRRRDIISVSVPGLVEDLVARRPWGIFVRWSVLLLTVMEVAAAIIIYSMFASVFGIYIFLMLGWCVSMVWLYTAYRYHTLTGARAGKTVNDGVDSRLIFLYYAGLSVVSGAGFVHGWGAARDDHLRHKALALKLFGTGEHDRLLLTAAWKSLWFLLSTLIASLLVTRCSDQALNVCTSGNWDTLAWACFGCCVAVHVVYTGLLLIQRHLLTLDHPAAPTHTEHVRKVKASAATRAIINSREERRRGTPGSSSGSRSDMTAAVGVMDAPGAKWAVPSAPLKAAPLDSAHAASSKSGPGTSTEPRGPVEPSSGGWQAHDDMQDGTSTIVSDVESVSSKQQAEEGHAGLGHSHAAALRVETAAESKGMGGAKASFRDAFMTADDWAATPLDQHQAWADVEKQAKGATATPSGVKPNWGSTAKAPSKRQRASIATTASLGSTKSSTVGGGFTLRSAQRGAAKPTRGRGRGLGR